MELVRAAGLEHWPHNALRVSLISYSMFLNPDAAALADAAGHSETILQTIYKEVNGASKAVAKGWFDIVPSSLHCDDKPHVYPPIP